MNKHTQGIWKGRETIKDALGRVIAVVHYSAFDSKNGIPLAEGYANSQLIRTAPELLQAADELISLNNDAGPTEWKQALQALAHAVAKADGRDE